MTRDEWHQLGLLHPDHTPAIFNAGSFTSFFIEDAALGGFRLVATSKGYGTPILGYFDALEQAEAVALTLRMAK